MGAIAESMLAYADPLLRQTDGSPERMNKALQLAMICWNLSLISDADRDRMLAELQGKLRMDDKKFRVFLCDIVNPMIRRHREMFPEMNPARRQWIRNEDVAP